MRPSRLDRPHLPIPVCAARCSSVRNVQKKPAAKAKPLGTSNLAPQQPQGHHAGKAIEDIYQKKTQLEHILLRPDTYIGSTEKQQQPLWVHDGERMTFKPITYAPGLFKIFDEILVNAADNKVRDPTMDTVRVDIDQVSRCKVDPVVSYGPKEPIAAMHKSV